MEADIDQLITLFLITHLGDVQYKSCSLQEAVTLLLYLSRGWKATLRTGEGKRNVRSHSAESTSHSETVLSVAALNRRWPLRLQLQHHNVNTALTKTDLKEVWTVYNLLTRHNVMPMYTYVNIRYGHCMHVTESTRFLACQSSAICTAV